MLHVQVMIHIIKGAEKKNPPHQLHYHLHYELNSRDTNGLKLCTNSGYVTGQRGQNDQRNLMEILEHTNFQALITAWL